MTLRALLRRIQCPVLLSQSGPRIHGISPAAASRFMGTRSQGVPSTVVEQHKDLENLVRLRETKKGRRLLSIDEENKLHKEIAELHKSARFHLDEYSRAIKNLEKLGDVLTALLIAIQGF